MTSKSRAMLSLDLDDLWSYLRAYGDPLWAEYPSFLDIAVPRILRFFDEHQLRITIFVVGRDAEASSNRDLLRSLIMSGHEIANHSFDHASDFHTFSSAQLHDDFDRSEAALADLGAAQPQGFRGPSSRLSGEILELLSKRTYQYDASTFPTFIGPLARAWQGKFFKMNEEQKQQQNGMFGGFADARRPLDPYQWQCSERTLVEIPVSTMPFARLPIHWTYVNYLASFSTMLAKSYVKANIALSRATQLQPSLLLHATDFTECDDRNCPEFLPGMKQSAAAKRDLLHETLLMHAQTYEFGAIEDFVSSHLRNTSIETRHPDFKARA